MIRNSVFIVVVVVVLSKQCSMIYIIFILAVCLLIYGIVMQLVSTLVCKKYADKKEVTIVVHFHNILPYYLIFKMQMLQLSSGNKKLYSRIPQTNNPKIRTSPQMKLMKLQFKCRHKITKYFSFIRICIHFVCIYFVYIIVLQESSINFEEKSRYFLHWQ